MLLALPMLALLLSGCGGGGDGRPAAGFERVRFRAADGVLLSGRLYGDGRRGVVLAHMGRGGDSQADWAGLARVLARRGYRVLTYDRRGVCPRNGVGCSHGTDDYGASWQDVVGAAAYLRRHGVEQLVVAGASIGAMAALQAASTARLGAAGVIELAGINHASGYDFDRAEIRRIRGLKVFVSAREDIYGGADAAREWHRWAAPPKRLELLPGSDHGTDLLRPGNPLRRRTEQLLVRLVDEAAQ